MPTVGSFGPHDVADRDVEHRGIVERGVHELELIDGALHLGRRERRVVLDHRELRQAVLAHRRDGFADRVARVDVDERSQRLAPTSQHRGDAEITGAQEAVVGHPLVVEDAGEVPASRIGNEDDDDVARLCLLPRPVRQRPTAVPPEPPMSKPSSRATRRAIRNEASSLTGITRSTTEGS